MKKKLYLEILRCISIFFVIFNHTGVTGFQLYTTTDVSIKYFLYGAFSVLCKVAVPIFFMISGILLLSKEETLKDLYKKRVYRIFIVLVLISIFYYLMEKNFNFNEVHIKEFFRILYSSRIAVPLWYLYSYLGFLITLPFLRKIVKDMDKKEFLYFLKISMFFCIVIPIFNVIFNTNLNQQLSIFIIQQNVLFPIIGFGVEKYYKEFKINKKKVFAMLSMIIICSLIAVVCNRIQIVRTGNKLNQGYLELFNLTNSLGLYLIVRYSCEKITFKNYIKNVIYLCGESVFGIYLLEYFLRKYFYLHFYKFLQPIVKSFCSSLLSIGLCICIGMVMVLILKKIPILKKYI